MGRHHLIIGMNMLLVLAVVAPACAQNEPRVRLSQRATVSQTIDRTVVTVEYSRRRSTRGIRAARTRCA